MLQVPTLAVLLRRDRSELASVGLVTLLVAFTVFICVAGVRLFERSADDGLRREVAAASVVQRSIQLSTTRLQRPQVTVPEVADWQAEGDELRTMFEEPLRTLVGDGNLAVGSVRLSVTNPPLYPLFINLRYQDEFPELVDLVSGRWPASTSDRLPPVVQFRPTGSGGLGFPVGTDHSSDDPRRFEVALQESTAREIGVTIGSVVSVAVDYTNPMLSNSIIGRADIRLAPTELEVTGLYRVRDLEADGWFGDPRLRIDDLGNTRSDIADPIAYINAYVSQDALPGLVSSRLPFEYRWRFPILVDRLDADGVAQLRRGLRILESPLSGADPNDDITAEAGLLPILERHSAVRTASEAVLALAASGPVVLAAGAIAMAVVLLGRRRRAALIVARGRGASGRLLLAASLIEAVVVAVLACSAGLGLAIALEPGAELEPSLVVAIAIGLVAVVVLGGAAWSAVRQPLGALERGARPARQGDPRRLVAELSIVAFAVTGAYVLRQRGIAAAGAPATGSDAGSAVAFDPFLAAVPPLIALAAGITAARFFPPVMAIVGWLATKRRDLVPVLGMRTVAREQTSNQPALVLVLALAFAAFTSVVSTSVDRAQQNAGWNEVGADVRLQATGSRRDLPLGLDAAAIPGVTATASGFDEPRVRAFAGSQVATTTVHALDAAAYAAVVEGSPIEPDWPHVFLEQPIDGPLPAIVSTRLANTELGLGQGDEFEIDVLGRDVPVQVVEVRSGLAGVTTGDSFVIVPYSWLEHEMGRDVLASVMWIRVPADAVGALTELIGAEAGVVRVDSRYGTYAALRDQPLLGAVGAGFALAFGVSVAYAVLTILGAVVLSVGRRTRDVAILRTLGLDGRQATRLTLVEHAPPILVALVPGLALGIGIAFAVAPALGLGALSGSRGETPLAIDWVTLAALSASLAALALAAVVLGSWLARRAAIVNALRISSE